MTSLAVRTVPLPAAIRRRGLQQATTASSLSARIPSIAMPPLRWATAATSRSSLQLRSCSSRISGGGLTASMRLTRHRPGSAPFPRCRRDLAQEMTVEPIVPSARSRLRPRSSSSSSSTSGTGRSMAAKSQTRSQSTIVPPLGNGGGAASAEGASLAGMSSRQKAWRDILKMLNVYLLKPRVLPIPRWIAPKQYTITYAECFGHASFILVAASYATDDFVALRTMAVIGSTACLVFTYFHPNGRILWLPFKWNALFIAINSYRLGLIMYQRYLTDMMPEEMKRIRDEHFYVVDPIDWSKLISLGREEVYEPGALIVQQGDMNPYIRLVLDGDVEVMRDGQVTYQLNEGNFISESGLHAGILLQGRVESCAAVVASRTSRTKIRVLTWDRTELIKLLEKEKGMRSALKAALSWDIIRKLKGQRLRLASGNVQDPSLWTLKRKEQGADRYAAILHNMLNHANPHEHIDQLIKYRAIHHISDEQHRVALARCGWTEEEFLLGRRLVSYHDDEEWEEEHNENEGNLTHKALELKRKAARLVRGALA